MDDSYHQQEIFQGNILDFYGSSETNYVIFRIESYNEIQIFQLV